MTHSSTTHMKYALNPALTSTRCVLRRYGGGQVIAVCGAMLVRCRFASQNVTLIPNLRAFLILTPIVCPFCTHDCRKLVKLT